MVEAEIDETIVDLKPFNMVGATLVAVRNWIDKIADCSLCWIDGQPVSPDNMIVVKHKMTKQLIMKSAMLIEKYRNEIKVQFYKIELEIGSKKDGTGIFRNIPMYSKSVDYALDDIIEDIQIAIKDSGYSIEPQNQ